jgi:hypothetical protein
MRAVCGFFGDARCARFFSFQTGLAMLYLFQKKAGDMPHACRAFRPALRL